MTDTGGQGGLVDKTALLGDRDDLEEEVRIGDFGVVKIRALTRAEVLRLQQVAEKDGIPTAEAQAIASAVVEPRFTIDEVRRWQKIARGGEIQVLAERINKLAGMSEEELKAATDRFSEGRDE